LKLGFFFQQDSIHIQGIINQGGFMKFFAVFTAFLILMHGYIGWRFIVPAQLRRFHKCIAWGFLFLFPLFLPLTFQFLMRGINTWWSDLSGWIGYISLGFFSLVLAFLLVRDLIWIIAAIMRSMIAMVKKATTPKPASNPAPGNERRCFLIQSMNLGLLGTSALLTGCGFYEARRRPALVKVSVPIYNLPKELEGLQIAQISDLHVGITVKRDYVERIVRQVNDLEAPIIAFTGDLADGLVSSISDEVAPLRDLYAPYGKFFVTGNHEYYAGVEDWVEEIERLGFTVLINSHRTVNHRNANFVLAGVTDYSGGRFLRSHISNPKRAIEGAGPGNVKILLAHQPRSIFAAAKAGFDLQISGHTHGGQYIPWNILVELYQPFTKGLHRYKRTWIYVNRGTGYWGPPMRLGIPSEITLFTLTGLRTSGQA
jgi:predicted MPP superfamily phosphohydrolase